MQKYLRAGKYKIDFFQRRRCAVLVSILSIVFLSLICCSDLYAADAELSMQPQSIEFCIADIKYHDQALKILEFGSGPRSGFDGYDNLVHFGAMWGNFWDYLSQFKLPMWYLKTPTGATWLNFIASEKLLNSNGCFAQDAGEVEKFVAPLYPESSGIYPDYKGLFIINKANKEYFPMLDLLKKKFPKAVVVNEIASKFVFNKSKSDRLFRDYDLKHYRPKSMVCFKQYSSTLAKKISDTLGCEMFVIKPLNAQYGKGIIFVEKPDLDTVLQNILVQTKKGIQQKNVVRIPLQEAYEYWAGDSNSRFIVEEYVPSKFVQVDGKRYDATLRAVFTMHRINQQITITVLGLYWKLPSLSIDDQGSLNEIHQSYQYDRAVISAPVDPIDAEKIRMMLATCLTKVYARMIAQSKK